MNDLGFLEQSLKNALEDIEKLIILTEQKKDIQSKIYQLNYQKSLRTQIKGILEELNKSHAANIEEFVEKCYGDGFIKALYSISRDGIPLLFPIDQRQMMKAIKNDTKLSKSLYDSLEIDTKKLNDVIRQEISRGIATGEFYEDIARNIKNRTRNLNINRARVIASTEGHRVAMQGAFDSALNCKKSGADIVKQWDATEDRKTRSTHAYLDGQIRELEEPFENQYGQKAMYPSGFGIAKEDVNCRCVMLQRARWALDDQELEHIKKKAEYFAIDKAKDLKDFKQKFLKMDELSKKREFVINKDRIHVKNVLDKDLMLYIDRSKTAKKAMNIFLDKIKSFPELPMILVFAKLPKGKYGGYDYAKDTLYINGDVISMDFRKEHHYASNSLDDYLNHEMAHVQHRKRLKSGNEWVKMKQIELEEYISNAIKSEEEYLLKYVSKYAQEKYHKTASIAEIIAEVMALGDRNKDKHLYNLVKELLGL